MINLIEQNSDEKKNEISFQEEDNYEPNFKFIGEELEKNDECKKIFRKILLEYENVLKELEEKRKIVTQQEIEIKMLEKNEEHIKKILNKTCKKDLGYSYNQLSSAQPNLFKRGIIEDWSRINKLKKRKFDAQATKMKRD